MAANVPRDDTRFRPAGYTREENMRAYDRLPKKLRLALQESDCNWSAASIAKNMRKLKLKADYVAELIRKRDLEYRSN